MCVHITVQLSYTTQHRIVLIIFPLILQTIIIAQMMSAGGEGAPIPNSSVSSALSSFIFNLSPHIHLISTSVLPDYLIINFHCKTTDSKLTWIPRSDKCFIINRFISKLWQTQCYHHQQFSFHYCNCLFAEFCLCLEYKIRLNVYQSK